MFIFNNYDINTTINHTNIKYLLGSLLILSVLFTACSNNEVAVKDTLTTNDDKVEEEEIVETNELEDGIYTIFSLNVHDWVNPELSIATINKVIDIHEKYDVPIDIYLTDPTFHNYMEMAPDLIDRFINSPVVDISYHYRPPYPYYKGFDYIGLKNMDEKEMYEKIMEYETHAIDLETGLPKDEPGGFKYIADTLGKAPTTASISVNGSIGNTLGQVFSELGAIFTVAHGADYSIGDKINQLFIRPENFDLKLYEHVRNGKTGAEVIAEAIEENLSDEGVQFLGVKYHENNFYWTGTPFWAVYWETEEKTGDLEPPYDLTAQEEKLRPFPEQDKHWALYESAVSYANEQRDEIHPMSVSDLVEYVK